jgi:hypothetical protein
MPQICDMEQTALLPLRRKKFFEFFGPKNLTALEMLVGYNEGVRILSFKQVRLSSSLYTPSRHTGDVET